MREVLIFASLIAIACLSMNCSGPEVSTADHDILQGVAFVDMYAATYSTERPLLSGEGRYYPGGAEMVFQSSDKKAEYHAVFPQGVTPPRKSELGHSMTLRGRFEELRATPDGKRFRQTQRPVKRIPEGYRYFVVSSWEIDQES